MPSTYQDQILPLVPELTRAALRLTRAHAAADDLVQDALARSWSAWGSFEPGTNARAWVHRILFNTYVNHYRRTKRERLALAEIRRTTASSYFRVPTVENGFGDEVAQAVGSLPSDFQRVIRLVDVDGLSYQRAARELDCPVGTVMSRLHRGRRALRGKLGAYAVKEGYIATAA